MKEKSLAPSLPNNASSTTLRWKKLHLKGKKKFKLWVSLGLGSKPLNGHKAVDHSILDLWWCFDDRFLSYLWREGFFWGIVFFLWLSVLMIVPELHSRACFEIPDMLFSPLLNVTSSPCIPILVLKEFDLCICI